MLTTQAIVAEKPNEKKEIIREHKEWEVAWVE